MTYKSTFVVVNYVVLCIMLWSVIGQSINQINTYISDKSYFRDQLAEIYQTIYNMTLKSDFMKNWPFEVNYWPLGQLNIHMAHIFVISSSRSIKWYIAWLKNRTFKIRPFRPFSDHWAVSPFTWFTYSWPARNGLSIDI